MGLRKLILALALILLPIVGYVLFSRAEERVAMLVRDGRHEEAMEELDRLLSSGRDGPIGLWSEP